MAAARRRDTGDPEPSKIPLPIAAVAIGVLLRLVHRFRSGTEEFALRAVIAFRKLESLFVTCAGLGPAFRAWYASVSSSRVYLGNSALMR